MGIVMFVQQTMMTPAAGGGAQAEQMQKMMKFMPIMFTAFMLFLPSGVVLYYFVSLLIGLAQQFYIRRSFAKKREAETA
jgi:YidC/Oxa1 family membrane protein insertase